MTDLRPAQCVWWGTVAAVLGADVVLIRTGRAPVTDVLRTRPGRLFLGVLAGHVLAVLGPADPFLALGKVATWAGPRGRVLP